MKPQVSRGTHKVKKMVEIEAQETVVTLQLSEDDARALSEILTFVSGSMDPDSPRTRMGNLRKALGKAGYGPEKSALNGFLYRFVDPSATYRSASAIVMLDKKREPGIPF